MVVLMVDAWMGESNPEEPGTQLSKQACIKDPVGRDKPVPSFQRLGREKKKKDFF